MARVRQIKPDFFTDAKLAACGYPAMVLFAGLWTLADREGRLKDIPFWIHGQVFPFDETINIDALLSQLAASGLINRYKIGLDLYIQVVNFKKHQTPHKKEAESVIPCNPKTRSPGKGSAQHRKRQCSAPEKAVLSPADSNSNSNSNSNTGIRNADCEVPAPPDPVVEIVSDLNRVLGLKPGFKLNSKNTIQQINARIAEGFKVADFKIVHRKKFEEWRGTEMAVHLNPDTLYRPSKFEKYLNQPEGLRYGRESKTGTHAGDRFTAAGGIRAPEGKYDGLAERHLERYRSAAAETDRLDRAAETPEGEKSG